MIFYCHSITKVRLLTSTVEASLTEQDSYFARFLAVMASNHTSMKYNSSGLNTRKTLNLLAWFARALTRANSGWSQVFILY